MGGYFSKKESKTGEEHTGKEGTDSSSEDLKKSRYRVVYADREVKVSELPQDLRSLFILKRKG